MKIVDFKEFVKYPSGTIFSYYEPSVFVGLWRKEKTLYVDEFGASDYFQQSLLPYHPGNDDKEISIGGTERWGEYSWEQKYAIYEEDDINKLKNLLSS